MKQPQEDQFFEPADLPLVDLLRHLDETPKRDAEAARLARLRFLAELDAVPELEPSTSTPSFFPNHFFEQLIRLFHPKETRMKTTSRSFIFAAVAALVLFLSVGTGLTARAAQSALPGDALYPVKTTMERTQLSLAGDAAVRARLQLQFAERRLDEMDGLISEGRFGNIGAAAREFEAAIQSAMAEMDLIIQGEPEQAASLMVQVADALSRYAQAINAMLSRVPEPVRLEMERALAAAQGPGGQEAGKQIEFSGVVESIAPDQWVISGQTVFITAQTELKGSIQLRQQVKVHVFIGENGSLTAREIEPIPAGESGRSQDDSSNMNGSSSSANSNENSNTNTNMNLNGNSNTNSNMNSNGNSNTNSNLNSNTNSNANQNTNSNVNDDGNENSNTNSNINDDWNSNTNTNTNINDNSNSNTNDDDDDDDDD
jgi:hypothetical protein